MSDIDEKFSDLDKRLEEIREGEVTLPHIIAVERMSGIGKFLKTVNNEDNSYTFSLRDEEIELKFDRPVFVSTISVTLASYDNVRGIKLIATDILTKKQAKLSITADKVNGSSVRFTLNSVITSLVLRKESIFPKDVKKIVVHGLFLNELDKFEKNYSDFESAKSEFLESASSKSNLIENKRIELLSKAQELKDSNEAASKEVEDLQLRISDLREGITEAESELAQIADKSESARQEKNLLMAQKEEVEKRKLSTESELQQKTQTLSNINRSISDSEEKLKGLVNNVNVFSEEFSGFVDQGRKQSKLYALLAVIPLLLLCLVVWNLFVGAVDLSTKFTEIPHIDLVTILVTRLPYVAIASLIVAVSLKIFYFLVARITTIHQQRLDLARLAIIAKDVSDASANNLMLSAEQVYEEKTYLKMALLRTYLAGQIGSFEYERKFTLERKVNAPAEYEVESDIGTERSESNENGSGL